MSPIEQIDRRIRAFLGGIRLAFRGITTLVKAAGAVQLVQLDALAGEQLQDAELFQQYGFTSNPLPGTMAIVLPIGGRTAHGVIVATEHGSYRLKNLAPGEVALYTDEGDCIVFKRGRVVEVTTATFRVNASTAVEFNTPMVSASQDIQAAGDVFDHTDKSMLGMRNTYNAHHHGASPTPDASM